MSGVARQLLPFLAYPRKGSKRRIPRRKRPKGNRIPIGLSKSLSTARPWAGSKATPVHGGRAPHLR